MHGFKLGLCIAWGTPWTILGVAACCTIVGIPVGIGLFKIATFPMTRLLQNRSEHVHLARQYNSTHEDIDAPWLFDVKTTTEEADLPEWL
jgi:hypothetical protein